MRRNLEQSPHRCIRKSCFSCAGVFVQCPCPQPTHYRSKTALHKMASGILAALLYPFALKSGPMLATQKESVVVAKVRQKDAPAEQKAKSIDGGARTHSLWMSHTAYVEVQRATSKELVTGRENPCFERVRAYPLRHTDVEFPRDGICQNNSVVAYIYRRKYMRACKR